MANNVPVDQLADQLNAMNIGPPLFILQAQLENYAHRFVYHRNGSQQPRRIARPLRNLAAQAGVQTLTTPEMYICEYIFNSSDPWTRYYELARRGYMTSKVRRIVRYSYYHDYGNRNWRALARQNHRNYYGSRSHTIWN